MDIDRMLGMCRRDQWTLGELDWSQAPRALSREDEETVVQLFTDMAEIELLAGALFEEQERRAEDPRLKEIFRSFVVDEVRHSAVAKRLARHYDLHHYREYHPNEALQRFVPHFRRAVGLFSDDVANAYITGGEIILDVALLRALDDFVKDDMSADAMRLINRDESRHIAVDFHMVGYYASDAYAERLRARPAPGLRTRVWGAWTFAMMLYHAQPFFKAMFFAPMDRLDPSGRRLREAFRRMQLLGARSDTTRRPFSRFLQVSFDVFNHPWAGPLLGGVASRLLGIDPRYLKRLTTDDEWTTASQMSFDEHAEATLAAKLMA
ncbi:MAG: hypothetical protein HY909_05605 [Deltaproteobacteria bacterium]|nr:hypothetical protein [Deltaproteobacteria bacterium]